MARRESMLPHSAVLRRYRPRYYFLLKFKEKMNIQLKYYENLLTNQVANQISKTYDKNIKIKLKHNQLKLNAKVKKIR